MASFGILGGVDALKSALKIQKAAADFGTSIAKTDLKNTLGSLGADSADFKNVIPSSVPTANRSVAEVESGVKEVAAFLDSPEGKILQEIESAA